MKDIISIIIFSIVILLIIKYLIKKRNPNFTYVDAMREYASTEPNPVIKELAMYNPTGFVFGQKNMKFITRKEHEQGHILVVGGSGSGKSSCVIIPTLITWNERVFAIDIKGELKAETQKARKNLKCFDISDPNAYGYDPFYLLKKSDESEKVQIIDEIVISLIPMLAKSSDNSFWIESSQSMLKAGLLYFSNLGFSFIETVTAILTTDPLVLVNSFANSSDIRVVASSNKFTGMKSENVYSIYAEVSNKLSIFLDDPKLAEALKRDKVLIPEDLENGYDIYLVIPESNLTRWGNFFGLILNQFLKFFEQRENNNKKPILFLLDEFPRLGKINSVIADLGTLRSKGITMCLVVQSLAQIEEIYGKTTRRIVAENCPYKLVLEIGDVDSQNYFSALLGTKEVLSISFTTNTSNEETKANERTTTGTSTSKTREPIRRPEEFSYMEKILLCASKKERYMWLQRTPFYSHEVLQRILKERSNKNNT